MIQTCRNEDLKIIRWHTPASNTAIMSLIFYQIQNEHLLRYLIIFILAAGITPEHFLEMISYNWCWIDCLSVLNPLWNSFVYALSVDYRLLIEYGLNFEGVVLWDQLESTCSCKAVVSSDPSNQNKLMKRQPWKRLITSAVTLCIFVLVNKQ